ncbi:hypothetical protein [Xanthomonas sacchari]|uniref:hypothetical protein n=1 Tax=Xanthomonas sacchari TaxID=56458 RepID=UPI000581C9AC|nr:hypothetical protein [Xanthomonas sacchari]AJC48008.1 hypothetical protein SB85_19780 [Xanthomonas sacchari]
MAGPQFVALDISKSAGSAVRLSPLTWEMNLFFALPRQGNRIETAPGAHSFAIRHADDTQV